ncbi:FAD-dependent oxidoreductase [Enterococcus dongliensis]|uniref:FAD-dependent oxidoreductase n=1 Tax=Enterococcus dongliensis TaxID=2559925 RepID=A0AAW8TQ40_9ENTE|nr:FAD-dependent oxidoreductase [Enterococcus dongliensis]MDT2597701.1 FAD-dependent oxidoreductase [Enterococcus dongliensis]MDT2635446.1 FAD-dependent oxidoreductase [Enterococcus dongliensis]MDT2638405.1 FAD-dependent oxidoreductase [Enterococcus dongliensis]MDT2643690.1 FAD-dependent oxidoreductase [Enterococcus dongliensis]MDT2648640.1 FAD-dependent oxidoreductase [Enterococcus dongliensis]
MKIVIVGGVAGGMSAATRLRRLMEDAEIVVLEKGPFVSFANCGLPYYVSGEIAERDALLVQTPASLNARFNLDVRPFHEVTKISPEKKTVTVKNEQGIFEETYDKLILSPGAKPLIPQMTGLTKAKNVFSLRNVPDLDQIMHALENKPVKATVIGAGFIGLEMAENLKTRGLEVTVIEKAPHVLPPLDEEMAAFVQNELIKKDIRVITGESAQSFSEEGKKIKLTNGEEVISDLTILSVGVRPENTLAEQAGLATGLGGGILVDEKYQTSQSDIFAVGDAIVVKQSISGEDALISLASPANRQGRQVADVIAGLPRTNRGSIGTAIVRVFDLAAAATGLSERTVKQLGLNYQVVHVSGKDHASYYPGASELTLKLIFDPKKGTIFGAQGVGANGVDKRIDILATAIKGDLTIFDLPELEFTYAPPFGSAKDSVNMLGYAAINLAEGISESIQWYQLKEEQQKRQLLDVRNPKELANGRFPDAINIPLNQLRERISELDPTQDYLVSCHSGLRSYIAERLLKQHGFNVKNLDGAFALYKTVRPEELIYE